MKSSSYVYPNPADNILNLSVDEVDRVEIYNLLGKLMLSEANPDSKIDVSSIPQGLYIVKIITDNDCYTEKFIKK